MYYNYKDLLEETRNKEFSFESLETADSYELFWLPEIDPYKKLEHQYGTPINPEELYYYDHDFEEACENIVKASVHNLKITFKNYYFDEELIEQWQKEAENEETNISLGL